MQDLEAALDKGGGSDLGGLSVSVRRPTTITKSAAQWLCAVAACLVGASCTMETRSYWEPSAPKGDVGRLGFGGCSGATPSFIFFHPPDLDHVNVAVGPAQDDQLVLLIGKIGASGMEQLFNHDEGPRLETWRHQPMHISAVAANIISISWGDGSKTTGLDIPVREQSIVLKDEAFRQGIPLNGVDSDWFDLDLPALSFDGSVLEFPRIRFTRVRRMLINPINC